MCKRSNPDPLVKHFLERYRMNLLSLPGNRVRCGSVYIKQGKALTAPGDLADLITPALELPPVFRDRIPELRGVRSAELKTSVGIGLLESFLLALGGAALFDKFKATAEESRARGMSVCFTDAERESISPTGLAAALIGHRFRAESPLVVDGNRYFVAGAVVRTPSISVRMHHARERSLALGVGVAQVADADASIDAERRAEDELTYEGPEPIGFAVELYELLWSEQRGSLAFKTPRGALPVVGVDDGDRPEPVFVGEDDEAIVVVERPR